MRREMLPANSSQLPVTGSQTPGYQPSGAFEKISEQKPYARAAPETNPKKMQ